jgi:hypothetical protein
MTDEERRTVTDFMREAIKTARQESPKKANVMDKVNLLVTALAFLIGPICWLLVSQKIDLRVGDVISSALTDINGVMGRQEQHIDSVDNRENSDKSIEDLKIESLQDTVAKKYSLDDATNKLDP